MPPVVLLLCAGDDIELMGELVRMGLMPLARSRVTDALHTLRHQPVAWVVIDDQRTDSDLLELVLNVRDIDEQVPIGVVTGPQSQRSWDPNLADWDAVYALPSAEGPSGVVQELHGLMTRVSPELAVS